ncbi:MAG: TRZ/ATZ family hydrolase [Proteobacteria bacterium]|jgi:5-methylthioadenosine/S-adenosylhomocysteine deaminase|nr:TRZ/ATZ family hydrolase [Pseudomonadota bacterium]
MTTAPAGSPRADTLLCPEWVLPMTDDGPFCQRGWAVALAEGKIAALGPADALKARWPQATRVSLPKQALLPGFVNAHGHAAMSLFRGFADDMPLGPWLEDRIWPLEGRYVSPEFVADGTALAAAEMLRGGTTTFSDMYFFPEVAASVALRAGLRAQLCCPLIQFPTAWASGPEEGFRKTLELRDQYRDHDRIQVAFGPHSSYALSPEHMARVATLAEELDLPVQIHLQETAAEVEEALKTHGERPIASLERYGLLSPRLQAVHLTQVSDADLDRLQRFNVAVVHCPQSNLKLASGFAPVARFLKAGLRVALGTDGAASNNALSMLRELQVAALLAKAVAQDATALPAQAALRMATRGGAEVLGLDHRLGRLEAGYEADLVAISLGGLEAQPVYHPEAQLAYSVGDAAVRHCWVGGKAVLKDGALTTLDPDALTRSAARWQHRMGAA